MSARQVYVKSSMPNTAEDNRVADVPAQDTPPPLHLMYPIAMKALKVIAVPIFAVSTSLSLPILIVLVNRKMNGQRRMSLEQKILEPLIPYLALLALRTWLLWNSVGHRLNGLVDAEIQPADEHSKNDTNHVIMALLANTASITTALLGVLLVFPDGSPALLWTAAIALGILNYIKDLFTELADGFRKHVEHRRTLGQKIKPFLKQKYIENVFNYIEYFGLVIREILPIVSGVIHAQAASQTATALFAGPSHKEIMKMSVPLWLLIYFSSAYATRFELVQFRDNVQATGKQFVIDNTFSQSSVFLARLTGKICSGQVLIDLLKKLGLSTEVSANIVLMVASIGLTALFQKALNTYVSSTNSEAVNAGNEGIVMNYLCGQQAAIRLAPKLETGIVCVAISLSVMGTFAKSATVRQQAFKDTLTRPRNRVVIVVDIDEEHVLPVPDMVPSHSPV